MTHLGVYSPLLFMVVGLLLYFLPHNVKVVELGRLVFFAGALVGCWLVIR